MSPHLTEREQHKAVRYLDRMFRDVTEEERLACTRELEPDRDWSRPK